jgi:ATP synthase protein I
MLASYAVILRRSAAATAPAAAVMMVLSAIIGGGKGVIGALLGVALVAAFFGLDALVVSWVGRRRPGAAIPSAVATYLAKVLVLLFFAARFSGTTAFNGKLFGLTAVVCVVVLCVAQAVTTLRLKIPYVEVDVHKLPGAGMSEPGTPCPQPGRER